LVIAAETPHEQVATLLWPEVMSLLAQGSPGANERRFVAPPLLPTLLLSAPSSLRSARANQRMYPHAEFPVRADEAAGAGRIDAANALTGGTGIRQGKGTRVGTAFTPVGV
jgi:hypothetical protein